MIKKAMILLTHRGEGPAFSYAGQPMHILAGHGGQPEAALAFMREIGAALTPDTPPDPDRLREIYTRHASRLLP